MAGDGGVRWDVLACAGLGRQRPRQLFDLPIAADTPVCFDQAVLRPGELRRTTLSRHVRDSAAVTVSIPPDARHAALP
jgi:hypothetical protein